METPQATSSSDTAQITLIQKKMALEASLRAGIDWFFWIAGLSLINSVVFLMGGSLSFVIGLGATQFVDGIISALTADLGASVFYRLVGFGMDVAIAGVFVIAGVLGRKRYGWAVIFGMILYALDGLLFLLVDGWLAIAFHAWALWGLWRGLQAINQLKAFEENEAFTGQPISAIGRPPQ